MALGHKVFLVPPGWHLHIVASHHYSPLVELLLPLLMPALLTWQKWLVLLLWKDASGLHESHAAIHTFRTLLRMHLPTKSAATSIHEPIMMHNSCLLRSK